MRLRLHTLGIVLAASLIALTPPAGAASRGDHSPASADSAEGFWVARMPDGVNVKWAILEGGETWGIYEAQGTILGTFHGVTRSANGALQGRGTAYDIPSDTVGTTDYTGSYIARQAITLNTGFGTNVSGQYASGYDQPASLGTLQGRYEGEALRSRRPVMGMSLQVTESGAFVMMSMQDCAASGQATPRPGGKNVFNVSLHFAGRACPLGDGVHATGIAHVNATSGELFMLGMNEARTDGWLYLGSRSAD